ncbi:MAG: hypothetical protein E7250_13380 [Paenibacillaceae bacterium]|uniref:hypothetical protein n=1 Tax=Lacrimispora xylanisolvens TaxID=384636 RepID=UPI000CEC0188|nr:hypothetical protein [Hungatella xylanolytica]MBE5988708.1 hypothetical protein [Paenibacillaceae bacterium]
MSLFYDIKEENTDISILPKIGFRESRNDFYITVPIKHSKTGKRYPVYGKTEEEVISKNKLEIALFRGLVVPDKINQGVPALHDMVEFTMKNFIYGSIRDTSYLKYESTVKNHLYNQTISEQRNRNI